MHHKIDRAGSASVGRGGGDGGVYLSVVRFYLAIVVGPFVSVPRRRRCTVRPHDTQFVAIHRGPRPQHHSGLLSVLSTVFADHSCPTADGRGRR